MQNLTVDMEQYDCPFIDTTDDHGVEFSAFHWDFNTERQALETRMMVEAADSGTLDSGLSALRNHQHLRSYRLLSKHDGVAQIVTTISETNAMSMIQDNNGYITGPFRIGGGRETWHIGFDSERVADDALAELDRQNEFSVESRRQLRLDELHDVIENAGPARSLLDGCRSLSSVERATLEAAVNEGCFENPRNATLDTLAEMFDVSKPAVSKNLRRGQQKVLSRIVRALSDLD
jgi:predicted DNA binding protein